MLSNPVFWVIVSFVLFIALSYKKVFGLAANALDDRSNKIKTELDRARTLREEAEAVLAQYKQKQAEYLKEAEAMLAKARDDASRFEAQARSDMKTALDARMRAAVEKIAREEEKAIQDVRNHVVDIALAAARAIIIEQVGNLPQDELVKLAVADIERKVH